MVGIITISKCTIYLNHLFRVELSEPENSKNANHRRRNEWMTPPRESRKSRSFSRRLCSTHPQVSHPAPSSRYPRSCYISGPTKSRSGLPPIRLTRWRCWPRYTRPEGTYQRDGWGLACWFLEGRTRFIKVHFHHRPGLTFISVI